MSDLDMAELVSQLHGDMLILRGNQKALGTRVRELEALLDADEANSWKNQVDDTIASVEAVQAADERRRRRRDGASANG